MQEDLKEAIRVVRTQVEEFEYELDVIQGRCEHETVATEQNYTCAVKRCIDCGLIDYSNEQDLFDTDHVIYLTGERWDKFWLDVFGINPSDLINTIYQSNEENF